MRHDTLLKLSGARKITANRRISALSLFLSFQEICSGCCTVAAHTVLSITAAQIAIRTSVDGGRLSASVGKKRVA
jgi:hypothetical protein